MPDFDLSLQSARDLNAALHLTGAEANPGPWRIQKPSGEHNIAVGVDASVDIQILGHVGYFCAGMNRGARITIEGNAGQGVAENMEGGLVHVMGDASQSAGATGRGGLLLIEGNASARCGISMKGIDIVVKGEIGHLSAFMGQTGRLVAFGGAGEALGDSIYEARLYVRGAVASLGADCIEKEMRDEHLLELGSLLEAAGEARKIDVREFRRFGSARKLYNFNIDNAGAY